MSVQAGRCEGDSCGLPGGPDPFLNDPLAAPLVWDVGLEPFIRIIDGAIDLEDDALLNRKTRSEQITPRTRFFDVFRRCYECLYPASGDPGLRPGHQGLPVGLARGHGGLRGRSAAGHHVQDRHPGRPQRRSHRRTLRDRHRPVRRLAGGVAGGRFSTSPDPQPGSPKGCCRICRPRRRTGCSTTSLRCRRPVVGWPPNTCRTPTRCPTSGCSASASGGKLWVQPQRVRPVLPGRAQRRRLPEHPQLGGHRALRDRAVRAQRVRVPRRRTGRGLRRHELRLRHPEIAPRNGTWLRSSRGTRTRRQLGSRVQRGRDRNHGRVLPRHGDQRPARPDQRSACRAVGSCGGAGFLQQDDGR